MSSLLALGKRTQCLRTDQTVLDFPRADISFITEQQLWLTSENGAFVLACHSTRVPLSQAPAGSKRGIARPLPGETLIVLGLDEDFMWMVSRQLMCVSRRLGNVFFFPHYYSRTTLCQLGSLQYIWIKSLCLASCFYNRSQKCPFRFKRHKMNPSKQKPLKLGLNWQTESASSLNLCSNWILITWRLICIIVADRYVTAYWSLCLQCWATHVWISQTSMLYVPKPFPKHKFYCLP